ncbi:THIKB thiolase, partial [Tyrannus savana]|nr:THIKB thiolase [Tyrannus savana]
MSLRSANNPGDISSSMMDNSKARDCLIPMGITSENVAEKFGVSRKKQDAFALASQQKAAKAQQMGLFKTEIVPVKTTVVDNDGNQKTITVNQDEGIRPSTTLEGLAKLRPAFKEDGSTTAGNASQVSDGAAAVLLAKRSKAAQLGLPVLGVLRSFAVVGVPPDVMGIGPAYAIPAAVEKAGLTLNDIDIYEINEAFASQAVYCVEKLGIPMEKVNPLGGAIALGHPLGCTGARQVVTLLNELKRRGKRAYGVVSMCIGTGMGAAAVFEYPGK